MSGLLDEGYLVSRVEALTQALDRLFEQLAAPWEYRRLAFSHDPLGVSDPGAAYHYNVQDDVLYRLGQEGWEVYLATGAGMGPLRFWLKRRAPR